MSTSGDRSTDQVFINCPFDPAFAPIFQAIVFAVKFCGFTPRCARELDDEQRSKRTLVLDTEQYRYQKFLSDLNGMDPHSHRNDPAVAAAEVRTWLRNVSRRKLAGPVSTADAWRRFEVDLPAIALAAGCDPADIPYADYEAMVTDWLAAAR